MSNFLSVRSQSPQPLTDSKLSHLWWYLAITLVAKKNMAMTEQERHFVQEMGTAGCCAEK